MALKWWVGLCLVVAPMAYGLEEETGVVQVLKGSLKSEVKLYSAGQNKAVALCDSADVQRVIKLSGMEVQLAGEWKEPAAPVLGGKRAGPACFQFQAIKVLKASSGRKAITGKLVQQEEEYFIEQDGGQRYRLPIEKAPPARYKTMVGQQVIADVKDFEKGPKVVSLILHP